MHVRSFAKINLGLRVVRKRSDGFHDIETIFQQIDLHDDMTIVATNDGLIHITTSTPACPADATNLAYRAADLLRKALDNPLLGCRIHLDKKIPAGAGLGGGSSNGAVALKVLNQLWGGSLSESQLIDLAARLGSDVPFFISGGLAFGCGRGERLLPIEKPITFFGLLICPEVHISTAWVYNNLKLNLTNNDILANFSGFIPKLDETSKWKKALKNDLTSVVFRAHPEFRSVIEDLYKFDAFYAQMSGSGSTLFGLFERQEKQCSAEHFLARKYKSYRTLRFKPIY
jgi:4-diphosphocytidyl-2-C-methyl-D-erythritol kinase